MNDETKVILYVAAGTGTVAAWMAMVPDADVAWNTSVLGDSSYA